VGPFPDNDHEETYTLMIYPYSLQRSETPWMHMTFFSSNTEKNGHVTDDVMWPERSNSWPLYA